MQHRRKIFLINKNFQFRFAFYVCSWLFALSLVYPLIIYNVFEFFFRYMSSVPNGPTLAAIQSTRKEVLWLLALLQIVFLVVTFLISIFISHRIAGPLYKLSLFFEGVKQGKFSAILRFRKNDHFQDLAADYNAMMQTVSDKMTKNSATISFAISQLERATGVANPEAKKELDQALTALRELK